MTIVRKPGCGAGPFLAPGEVCDLSDASVSNVNNEQVAWFEQTADMYAIRAPSDDHVRELYVDDALDILREHATGAPVERAHDKRKEAVGLGRKPCDAATIREKQPERAPR